MNKDLAEAFFKSWNEGQTEFTIKSSGSTGEPRPIHLHRRWMKWSAAGTAGFLRPTPTDKILCCLPVDKVGGLMMLVRAAEWDIPVDVTEPTSNPLLMPGDASILSLTPFQLYHIVLNPVSLNNLLKFREVLIGGGEISYMLEKTVVEFTTGTVFRHSYGMTETYSHIALRTLNGPAASPWFKPLPEVRVTQDESGCAVIFTPFYEEGLATNDMIAMNADGSFRVLGRKDFIINSGGMKLQAEAIEHKIYAVSGTHEPFVISSRNDDALGQKLVLVCKNREEFDQMDFRFLLDISPYAIPKEIIEIEHMPLNEGGKTDRLRIRELINM